MKISITALRESFRTFIVWVSDSFFLLLTRYHVLIGVVFLLIAGLFSVWIIVNSLIISISSGDVEVEQSQVPVLNLRNVDVVEAWLGEREIEHSRDVVVPSGLFKREY